MDVAVTAGRAAGATMAGDAVLHQLFAVLGATNGLTADHGATVGVVTCSCST